jgi:molybdopterin molybdotransferase
MTSPIAGADPHSSRPRELFNVLTPTDALRRLLDHLPGRLPEERIATSDGLDRVLAEDLVSPADLPSFPRSTMDGYAVRAADTYGASEGLPRGTASLPDDRR